MRMVDIIEKKKDGLELSEEEIQWFVKGYTAHEIPDYQASAFCMAVFFKGMTDAEIASLTEAMAHSGDTVDLSRFGELSVDKHSTGGVGDKTSLIVAPVMAALGCKCAKMSGRGLGHTGGTVDKLESIPGYRTVLSETEFLGQVENVGVAVIGQSGNLTPADKMLYALRDVTATVDSIPLIVSSIMSKKLAAGSKNIVLDVKVGSGAFMKDLKDATTLASKMVAIGRLKGRRISAVLTDMDVPLGYAVGNAMEVKEAVSVLSGEDVPDLYEVSVALCKELAKSAFGLSDEEAERKVREVIRSGAALEKMKEWVKAQGGDVSYIENPDNFPEASYKFYVKAPSEGYITAMNAERIGHTAVLLGAGRAEKEDPIDFSAGLLIQGKTGDKVEKGQVIATLYTNKPEALGEAEDVYLSALQIGSEKPKDVPLIYQILN